MTAVLPADSGVILIDEVVDQTFGRQAGPLHRPAYGNRKAYDQFEQELAEVIIKGMRDFDLQVRRMEIGTGAQCLDSTGS